MFYKKDLNNLYDRLREVEQTLKVNEEHDKNLEEILKIHAIDEMKIYSSIQSRLDKLEKIIYIGLGVLIAIEFLSRL